MEARRQGEAGVVSVHLVVARDGQIIQAQITRSSGFEILDQAALAMFQGARGPAFPNDMAAPQMAITLSIRYRLEDN